MNPVVTGEPASTRAESAMRNSRQRAMGAYYTPHPTAELMADWILRSDDDRILEPSMGDGVFLRAIAAVEQRRGLANVTVKGVEIDPEPFERLIASKLACAEQSICEDFLSVDPFPVDGALGNPPYVRLRNLPKSQARTAEVSTEHVLGMPMETSGSVWMAFLLHATRFLQPGGRLAMVLPHDVTYVRYARPMWRYLRGKFSDLKVVRVRERIFGEILQEVVLLFADDFGGATERVRFDVFESIADLIDSVPTIQTAFRVSEIEEGARPFTEALLPSELRQHLRGGLQESTIPMADIARFNIGYVAGDKQFFHPSREQIEQHRLDASVLQPAVTSTRQLKGAGVFTSGIPLEKQTHLFVPKATNVTRWERRYIEYGEEVGVSERYKCRVRKPWYVVPGLKTPDLIVSVFSEYPCMLENDAGIVASNSLLCGEVGAGVDTQQVLAAWYTPLTALHLEIQIHALGGGVFVLVPGEINRMRLPRLSGVKLPLRRLNRLVAAGDFEGANKWGRDVVLQKALGLPRDVIELVEHGRDVLMGWRKGRTTLS